MSKTSQKTSSSTYNSNPLVLGIKPAKQIEDYTGDNLENIFKTVISTFITTLRNSPNKQSIFMDMERKCALSLPNSIPTEMKHALTFTPNKFDELFTPPSKEFGISPTFLKFLAFLVWDVCSQSIRNFPARDTVEKYSRTTNKETAIPTLSDEDMIIDVQDSQNTPITQPQSDDSPIIPKTADQSKTEETRSEKRRRKRKEKKERRSQRKADNADKGNNNSPPPLQSGSSSSKPSTKPISTTTDKDNRKKVRITTNNINTSVITGYNPEGPLLARVHDFIVYDIPSTWDNTDLIQKFKTWGNLISMQTKLQKKYQTVRVKIELNQQYYHLHINNVWTVSLGGLPVRWFSAKWNLQERKQREKFQLALYDIPESMTYSSLFPNHNVHEFLTNKGFKSFKIINSNGKRKFIGYLETWNSKATLLGTQCTWDGVILDWCRHATPSRKSLFGKTKLSRGSLDARSNDRSGRLSTGSNSIPLGKSRMDGSLNQKGTPSRFDKNHNHRHNTNSSRPEPQYLQQAEIRSFMKRMEDFMRRGNFPHSRVAHNT